MADTAGVVSDDVPGAVLHSVRWALSRAFTSGAIQGHGTEPMSAAMGVVLGVHEAESTPLNHWATLAGQGGVPFGDMVKQHSLSSMQPLIQEAARAALAGEAPLDMPMDEPVLAQQVTVLALEVTQAVIDTLEDSSSMASAEPQPVNDTSFPTSRAESWLFQGEMISTEQPRPAVGSAQDAAPLAGGTTSVDLQDWFMCDSRAMPLQRPDCSAGLNVFGSAAPTLGDGVAIPLSSTTTAAEHNPVYDDQGDLSLSTGMQI